MFIFAIFFRPVAPAWLRLINRGIHATMRPVTI